MRENDLSVVLLVRAFEEDAAAGALLPQADREAAAREAARQVPERDPQRLLAARARLLYGRIVSRHPVVEAVRAMAGASAPLELALVLAGLLAGMGISALDGTRRIQILSYPLVALIAWNFAVYAWWLAAALRRRPPRSGLASLLVARFPAWLAARPIARSRSFDTTLAAALQRFVSSWFAFSAPMHRARGLRALHLAAAAVGVGLVAGLYVRGLGFDYRASWESTFLDANGVHAFVSTLYGPASRIGGLPLPAPAQLETLRWVGGGGEPAARWIHLIALTTVLFVVIPRLALALASSASLWRWRRQAALPEGLRGYYRRAFACVEGLVQRARALVMPYAAALEADAFAKLAAWIGQGAGDDAEVQASDPLPYGEEERCLTTLEERGGATADAVVLPFSLASTPEAESHGVLLQAVRDWLSVRNPAASLAVVVDETPYRRRMEGAPERIEQRRDAWRAFVAARGLAPVFLEL